MAAYWRGFSGFLKEVKVVGLRQAVASKGTSTVKYTAIVVGGGCSYGRMHDRIYRKMVLHTSAADTVHIDCVRRLSWAESLEISDPSTSLRQAV